MKYPLGWTVVHEISLVTIFRYANVFRAALDLAVSGKIRLNELIGARCLLPEAHTAFDQARKDKRILRSAIPM